MSGENQTSPSWWPGVGRLFLVRIARFTTGQDPRYAVVEGEVGKEELLVVSGDPLFMPITPTGERVPLSEARLLAPVIPRSKVVGVGRNFAAHAAELGNVVPDVPLLFLKPNTSVVGPDDPIVLPDFSQNVHYEAELAVVIGRICKDVPPERVAEVIFGYTVANDVSARDVQNAEDQWTRAKGFDSSCPLGPWIETELDTSDLAIRARLDGEVVQDGSTALMVRGVVELVSYISHAFTLLPGDVILTGTPAGVGPMVAGQRIEVEVEGIGSFSNPVVRR